MGTNVYKPQSSNMGLIVLTLIFCIAIAVFAGFLFFKVDNDKKSSDEKISELTSKIENLEKVISKNDSNIEALSNSIPDKYTEITDNLKNLDVLYVTNVSKSKNNYTLEGVIYSQYTISNTDYEKVINDEEMEVNNTTYSVKKDDESGEYGLYEEDEDTPSYLIKEKNSRTYYLEAQAQIKNVWKLTDNFRKITLDGDVEVENDYSEETSTVKDTFKDFEAKEAEETTNPNPTYTFSFEDGKCVKVVEVTSTI